MAAAVLPIYLERNGSYDDKWYFTDNETGGPLNLGPIDLEMQVRAHEGAPDLLLNVALTKVDVGGGVLRVLILGSELDEVAGTQERVTLAYDLRGTTAGIPAVLVKGPLYLDPGVTT